jgi:hypothetical protein
MADVPTYGGPRIQEQVGGAPRVEGSAPPQAFAGNVIGQGLDRLGAATGQASDTLAQHAQALQEISNKANADTQFSAAVKAMTQVSSNYVTNVHGADALPALPDVQDQFEQARQQYSGGLSPNAKSYYDQETRRVLSSLDMQARSHADQQQNQYIKTSANLAKQAAWDAVIPGNELSFNNAIRANMDHASFNAHLELGSGAQPEDVAAIVKHDVSHNYVGYIKGLMGTDPVLAAQDLAKHKDVLTPEDSGIEGVVRRATMPVYAAQDAQTLNAAAAAGGHTGAVGVPPLTTISTGSGGRAQVASNYAANFQGFLHDLEATGYKVNSVQGFNPRNVAGTDVASYHASGAAIDINPGANPQGGAGNLPPNVSELAKKWGLGWGGDWSSKKDPMHFSIASSEGGSVDLARAASGAVPGAPNNSVALKSQLSWIESQVPALAAARFPGQPDLQAEYAERLTATATTALNHKVAAMRDDELEKTSTVLDTVIKNNLSSIPPELASAYAALPPSDRLHLDSVMTTNGKTNTPERMQNYTKLLGMYDNAKATGIDGGFANLSMGDFGDLTAAQTQDILKKQMDWRAKVAKGQTMADPSVTHAMGVLKDALTKENLKPGDPQYEEFQGSIIGQMQHYMDAHVGKKPSDVDIVRMGEQAIQRRGVPGFLGLTQQIPSYEIPEKDSALVKDALTRAGYKGPITPGLVAQFYWRRNAK